MDTETTLRVAADLNNLSQIRRFVGEHAASMGVPKEVTADVLLATDEAATNVIIHGYQGQEGVIEVEVHRSGDTLVVYLRDQSPPFDPTTVPTPDFSRPLEQRPFGGMGVHFMRQLMDEVSYRVMPQGGNELIMKKKGVVSGRHT